MLLFLYLIPILVLISGVLLYPHNGKHEFLKLDLVQFFYAFVIAPLLFIWIKTFLFILLKTELGAALTQLQIFIIDTSFSVLCMYIFAFVVIHSLTASFKHKLLRDPLYDIFMHSEFFHLWLSHIMMFGGVMLALTLLGVANLFFTLDVEVPRHLFYILGGMGLLSGSGSFIVVWNSDPKQEGANFMRLMKLLFGVFFILHCALYFIFTPSFSAKNGVFWWSFANFIALVACSLFTYKSERANTLFDRISSLFKFNTWGSNKQLFKEE